VSLDGALGKIALRTRSAPRQLLQVPTASPASSTPSASSALLAGLITSGTDHHHVSIDANGHGEPLSHRAVLAIVEEIYDSVLDLEQLRRIQPALLANVATAAAEQEAGASGVLAEALSNAATTALAEWCVYLSRCRLTSTDIACCL
jgi:DNA topoisomerase 2-associated protein PAT1